MWPRSAAIISPPWNNLMAYLAREDAENEQEKPHFETNALLCRSPSLQELIKMQGPTWPDLFITQPLLFFGSRKFIGKKWEGIHSQWLQTPSARRLKCRTVTQSQWPRGWKHKLGQWSWSSRKNRLPDLLMNSRFIYPNSFGHKSHENSVLHLCSASAHFKDDAVWEKKKSKMWAILE